MNPNPPDARVLSPEMFSGLIAWLGVNFTGIEKVAVAVSGGADSMALTILLDEWCCANGIVLHALTVDHALRPESREEAVTVSKTLKLHGIHHSILTWDGEKPKTRIQESARDARYDLMGKYCQKEKIAHLFLAHHGNDQIETLLFRLLKSTGADGLSGMKPVTVLESGLYLLRPLLSVGHIDLVETCRSRGMDWIEDPSNTNTDYTRVRLRKIAQALEAEGLSPSRTDVFARRMAGIVDSVSFSVDKLWKDRVVTETDDGVICCSSPDFLRLPFDLRVRALRRIFDQISPIAKRVRLEEIERLVARIDSVDFRGATLGKCKIRKKKEMFLITKE